MRRVVGSATQVCCADPGNSTSGSMVRVGTCGVEGTCSGHHATWPLRRSVTCTVTCGWRVGPRNQTILSSGQDGLVAGGRSRLTTSCGRLYAQTGERPSTSVVSEVIPSMCETMRASSGGEAGQFVGGAASGPGAGGGGGVSHAGGAGRGGSVGSGVA